ncbi:MAG: M20/M25/M40 family metallo-hydrolase [Alphaproteobacteria bacterium]|nr:M20/M25/M40 family metallo-hydrolase [Alphaproteobacteria bacterium]
MKRYLALIVILALTGCAQAPSVKAPGVPGASASVANALKGFSTQVDPKSLRAFDQKMVDFGTRSTISDTVSDTRGIGAARRWVESVFRADSAACGGCLEIVTPSDVVTGPRYPGPTRVVDVVAILKGTTDPDRVIIIQGHLDSRNSDTMNVTDDAPGANDDASGVSAVLETARILSKQKFAATLVFAALSGEEQGLSGGKILADYAKAQGWKVEAVLNNDIIGASEGMNGMTDANTVRVFSEGVRAVETAKMAAQRRSNGGELDSPSRNLSRYMAAIAERYMPDFSVRMIYRMDRFGRGGDHAPFQALGFPAVRVTEGVENYDRQHQTLRTENGVTYGDTIDHVDFDYLAKVTRLNLMTMVSLASAPPPPTDVRIAGAVSPDTTVSWAPAVGADRYVVWWRDTTAPEWIHFRVADGSATSLKLEKTVIDDWFFGVSAVSAEGYASPVVFAGLVGDFGVPDMPPGP